MYLFKIYLFKGQSNTEAEFSLCWFTPQMAGGARFKIGPNWQPGTQSGCPAWVGESSGAVVRGSPRHVARLLGCRWLSQARHPALGPSMALPGTSPGSGAVYGAVPGTSPSSGAIYGFPRHVTRLWGRPWLSRACRPALESSMALPGTLPGSGAICGFPRHVAQLWGRRPWLSQAY